MGPVGRAESALGLGCPSKYVFLRSNRGEASFCSSLGCNTNGTVGLDTVYAFFLIRPLATFARVGGAFFSLGVVESRFEIFPSLSDAKNSLFEPKETCSVGRCRDFPSLGNNHLYKSSGSLWLSVTPLSGFSYKCACSHSTDLGGTRHCYPPMRCSIDQKHRMLHR